MKVSTTVMSQILREQRGAKPVTIIAETEQKVKQGTKNSPSPFRGKRVVKRSRVNGMIGCIYENSVNNQREREGSEKTFQVKPRVWGKRIPSTPIVEYRGKDYLEIKIENVLSTEYLVDGKVTPQEELRDYLPSKRSNANQELEKEVLLCCYTLDNVKEITLDKAKIEIVQ